MKRKLSKLMLAIATVAFAGALSAPAVALADSRTVNTWDNLAVALSESGTVVLGCDMSAEGNLLSVPSGVTVKLDLDGNTLQVSGIKNEGNLTVVNGTIEGLDPTYSAIESTGTLKIDANVIGARHALRIEGGTATIDGGAYSVKGASGMTTHVVNAGSGTKEVSVTINGGTFAGPKGTSSDSGYAVQAQGEAVVTINGGVFEKGMPSVVAKNGESAELVITGGTFDESVTAWLAEGAVQIAGGKVLYFDPNATTYEIGTVDDLWGFAALANAGNNFAGKTVSLTSDIDLGGKTWTPIASFGGELDGNGHAIKNFHIDATSARGGFFNVIEAGSGERVHDLTLSDVTATVGNNRFGTLANSIQGIVNRVTVKNVTVTTTHTGAWVGGMCAFMSWPWMNDCTVENLTVNAIAGADLIAGFSPILQKNSNMVFDNLDVKGFKVTVADTDSSGCGVGGFVSQTQRGWEYPKMTNCDITGIDITASGLVDVGGFIAWPGAHTTAENCTTEGKIDVTGVTSADCFAGGFFGNLGWNADLGQMGHFVSDCSSDVDIITKVAPAGGFVGSATNSNNASMYATFTDCIAFGDITCVADGTADIGGFAGDADRGTYLGCSASGIVANNGTGHAGQFIGALYDVTPKYDGRYPAGTRDYLADKVTTAGCSYTGGSSDLAFIGSEESGVTREEVFAYVAKIGIEHYSTLQAAIDACVVGNNSITLLADISEDVTIKQAEGVNVTIDGNDKTYSGTITIHGAARYEGDETLTIKDVKFESDEAGHYFIDSNSTSSTERYAHNVTVEDCSFAATGDAVNSAVAMRVRQGFDIAIEDVDTANLHSVLQAYGCKNVAVSGLEISSGKNGLSMGTSTGVTVEDCDISVAGYGIRADGTGAYDMTVQGSKITADLPIVVREATGAYALTVAADNTITGANDENYGVVFTNGDDGTYEFPTGKFTANVAGGAKVYPVSECAAEVDGSYYLTLAEALAAAETGDTVTMLKDATITETPVAISVAAADGVVLVVEGGTFASDPSRFVVYPYYAWKNGNVWEISYYVPPADSLPETGCADDAACNVFNDVDPDAWYHEYVDWANANGILRGYDDGSGNVGPEDVTLRSHVMVMLHRMAGEPAVAVDPGFNDVAEGAWYYEAVAWAAEVGLTTGYTDGSGNFGPADVMTREQMATVLYRFAVLSGFDVSAGEDTNILSYADALDISEYAVPALQWAVGAGVVTGYTNASGEPTGYIGPEDDAERGQFAAMLMRMDNAYGIL